MLAENINIEYIKIWLNIFCQKLSDSLKEKSIDTLPLINFILYKSKWFNSNSIHTKVFGLYEKFCLTLISINNSYLLTIIKILLENLVPKYIHYSYFVMLMLIFK